MASSLVPVEEERAGRPEAWAPSDLRANILLVDDREDKRLAMESIIADLGQNIVKATSGREALRHLLKQEFAVILLDVNMPGMDGFETALLIRERKSLENVPIIFISAINDAETHVSRGYSLGAVDYILAPIVPEILRAKVSVFVELFKITEQVKRQAAELRVTNQELEAFTYSIAHDLRAPFRQIHGYVEILQEDYAGNLPAEAQNYLKRIGTKARDMGQMVDDLLNLFGIANQTVDYRTVSLDDLVEEVVASFKKELKGRTVHWKVNPLPKVRCNYALMRQVFDNLISNALKYSRTKPAAKIEIGCRQVNGEEVIFIRDNGVGFDMKFRNRLFGVFQRLHREEEFEGTGVGLALVSRIIRKHGGRIWGEGIVGEGASFYFTLGKI